MKVGEEFGEMRGLVREVCFLRVLMEREIRGKGVTLVL